jgi:hypothetical protein
LPLEGPSPQCAWPDHRPVKPCRASALLSLSLPLKVIMLKYLVPLFYVGVHRDITTTVQAQVPEHEIAILQTVHGESNVYPGEKTGLSAEIDLDKEFDRLGRKYGDDAVLEAYGARAKGDIKRMVTENSTGTKESDVDGIQLDGPDTPAGGFKKKPVEVEATGSPSLAWSKADLTEYAEVHGIAVEPTANKPAILAAIERAAVAA